MSEFCGLFWEINRDYEQFFALTAILYNYASFKTLCNPEGTNFKRNNI
jgi:hypothetical protein